MHERSCIQGILVFTLLLCACLAHAQQRTVSVSGSVTLLAEPDAATIRFHVQREAATATAATREVTDTTRALLDIARDHGVADADLETTGITIHELYPRAEACIEPAIRAQQTLSVTLRDSGEFDALVDAMVAAGAWIQGDPRLRVADRAAMQQQALELALAEARSQARSAATALGLTLREARTISFSSEGYTKRGAAFMRAAPVSRTYLPARVPITQTGQVEFDSGP